MATIPGSKGGLSIVCICVFSLHKGGTVEMWQTWQRRKLSSSVYYRKRLIPLSPKLPSLPPVARPAALAAPVLLLLAVKFYLILFNVFLFELSE